ncbi:MAG: 1-deoxy-D-xylulose-5-phosphate reductoisomerase [Chloroflexi bacterium]|nr:1-deoxy-D-xylulose-5-phosphate reductoisomerase [Chloroflexota bacterium]
MAPKRLAVLGSTGSIGTQTLDVVRGFPSLFRVTALAGGRNAALLNQQIAEFRPEMVASTSAALLAGNARRTAVEDMCRHPDVDTVVIAISGLAGLGPTLAAVGAGKTVALANKESLVAAGELIVAEAKRRGAVICPVDSEHSAIWQCLKGEPPPAGLFLTASGGPFKDLPPADLRDVTPEQALRHPSWRMGPKVTIDSATLMNKGLEIIEARWLFDMPFDKIKVLIHPQSIVHSMVEFADGSVKAQMSFPDMRLPIQYALSYPERLANPALPRLDWDRVRQLDFQPPEAGRFPCLELAAMAGRQGGTYPAALCAADEAAVELFLGGKIRFTDIYRLVARVLEKHQGVAKPDMNDINQADAWARRTALGLAAEATSCC